MYGSNNVDVESPLEEHIPTECDVILQRMLHQKLIAEIPDQLTVNQYLPGQGWTRVFIYI